MCSKMMKVMMAALLIAGLGSQAKAETCPADATDTGVGLLLSVLRCDGKTPVAGGTLTPCETVVIKGRLVYIPVGPGGIAAAFFGGTLTVNTPAGAQDVTPVGGVPVLGPAECDGVAFVDSLTVNYTVTAADAAAGSINLSVVYAGGTAMLGDGLPGVGATTPQTLNVQASCDNGLFCDGAETCDPQATNGVQCGLCVPGDEPCVDDLFCSNVTCNEETDQCVTTDANTCPDNLFCADVACNEATDACDTTNTSTTVCPDNLFCADVACNEATDACDTTDTSTTVCTGGDICLPEICDEEADACVSGEPYVCNDNDPCTDDVCDPSVTSGDPCVYTDNGTCNAEGCTPGYWKANAVNWSANAWALSPTAKVKDYFTIPSCLSGCNVNGKPIGNNTLLQALSFQGGTGKCGAAEILLRYSVAALLNASSTCVDYDGDGVSPDLSSPAEVQAAVNEALASCNRSTMLTLGKLLDELNNAGCPIDQQGRCEDDVE